MLAEDLLVSLSLFSFNSSQFEGADSDNRCLVSGRELSLDGRSLISTGGLTVFTSTAGFVSSFETSVIFPLVLAFVVVG